MGTLLKLLPGFYGIYQPQCLPTSSISGLLLITLPLLLLLTKDYWMAASGGYRRFHLSTGDGRQLYRLKSLLNLPPHFILTIGNCTCLPRHSLPLQGSAPLLHPSANSDRLLFDVAIVVCSPQSEFTITAVLWTPGNMPWPKGPAERVFPQKEEDDGKVSEFMSTIQLCPVVPSWHVKNEPCYTLSWSSTWDLY
jgi:hypothetical protein